MVARINTGKSLSKVLHYNEHKVRDGEAEILLAHNFVKEASQLRFSDKVRWFERYTSLNERATTNVLHVSLNFDPSDILDNEKLIAIAGSYMERLGFGEQPYLVYRHHDAGHPHIHVVSTNIRRDGSRMSMHNIGRNSSEAARKDLESQFGLVKAQEKALDEGIKVIPVSAQKVAYGKASTKRAISNVLGLVIHHYKYGSLPELNAVLKLYNVQADRGEKGSVMYERGGLVYRVLDEGGKPISPPLKASSFYMKPTLQNLEQRFSENEKAKPPFAKRLRTAIDFALLKEKGGGLQGLIDDLGKEGIALVLRKNSEGVIYGMTYVDHKTKAVFNGSDLGKVYSAKAILERVSAAGVVEGAGIAGEKKAIPLSEGVAPKAAAVVSQQGALAPSHPSESLLPYEDRSTAGMTESIPWQLKKKKGGKKKRGRKL